jgi:membrane protein DedA with SNARE-associated domain
MITDILVAISHFITSTIDHMGYAGVALLMAIESAAIPLPSEVIMPFAGFLVESGRFSLWALGLAGAVGSTIGSLITYYIGYYGGRRLIAKYEHIVLVSQEDLDLTEKFFHRFKHTATFLGRILPVIRTFISIPAGIAKVPIIPFTINAFIGSFIWSYFLAWLGLKLGENWKHLETYFHKFDLVIGLLILAGIIYWIRRHIKRKNQATGNGQ